MRQLTSIDIDSLKNLCPGGTCIDVDLSEISQWRIGGIASLIVQPSTLEELSALRQFFSERKFEHIVIGFTTNLLFSDEGLNVPCIQVGKKMSDVVFDGNDVYAEAGAWVPGLAHQLMKAGLTGGEHICGIPGTLGGLICMNGGSLRKGIGSSIVYVNSVDKDGKKITRSADECLFSYRKSIFQSNNEVICSALMRFSPEEPAVVRKRMRNILADRRKKFPRKEPNCGSVFKSNPAMYDEIGPPGAAIEKLGFKGMQLGGALVSPRHANFIVNTGRARAIDVLTLINRIVSEVQKNTGFRMEVEACFVNPEGKIFPADQYFTE